MKASFSSKIRIDQKWMNTGKLLTEIVSDCLRSEEYYATDLTDDITERLSNNLRNGNALIVRADVVDNLQVSPPAISGISDEDSE